MNSPWPAQRLAACTPKDRPVTILGTGLTAVDTVLTLVAYGHQGLIRMISRNGFLPEASSSPSIRRSNTILSKDKVKSYLQKANHLRLSKLFRLFKLELRARHCRNPTDACPLARFRTSIYAAVQNTNALQDVLIDTRFIGPWLWSLLSMADKLRFQRRFGSQWSAHRYPTPIQTARSILRLMESGRLEVIGGLAGVETSLDSFILSRRQSKPLRADWLIDATGPSTDIRLSQAPLVQNLLHDGYGLPHSAGGMQVNPETLELIGQEGCTEGFYAVGQILSGELFATNAFWFNVDCASTIANRIIRRLYSQDPSDTRNSHQARGGAELPTLRNIA